MNPISPFKISALIIVMLLFASLRISAQKVSIEELERSFSSLANDSLRFRNLIDQIEYYRLNDLKKAGERTDKLMDIALKSKKKPQIARALFYKAVQARKEGNYDSSIVNYLRALKFFEEVHDTGQIASSYGSLGIAYWQLKEYEPALRFLRKAQVLFVKKGNPIRILTNLNNLAGVFFDLKQFDSAVVILKQGQVYAEASGDTASMADIYGNLGSVYLLMNDTANAMRLSLKAINYSIASHYDYQLFTSYSTVATVYAKSKNYKKAESFYLKTLEIANRLGAMEGRKGVYHDLAQLYHDMHEDAKAYSNLEKYTEVNDSLFNESRMKQATELEAKYQSEKKDKELIQEKADSERKTTITKALIIGLILLLLLAFFAFRGYLNKKKYVGIIETANREIKQKSDELATRNKDVIDSITYARRIQQAVLPKVESIYSAFPESFVYYRPKDIVSGDFYWFHEVNKDEYILACGDCTGHGVPGAFMTVIGCNLLNQIIIDGQQHSPGKILSQLDELLNLTLKQDENLESVQDGMDIALVKINTRSKECIITSAKRPVTLVRDNSIQEFKGSKSSLGGMHLTEKRFEEIILNYKDKDMLYFYTDGYTDQFGGDKGKKYSSKQLRSDLLAFHQLPIEEQSNSLEKVMNSWRGNLEQVDDMLVMGIKF